MDKLKKVFSRHDKEKDGAPLTKTESPTSVYSNEGAAADTAGGVTSSGPISNVGTSGVAGFAANDPISVSGGAYTADNAVESAEPRSLQDWERNDPTSASASTALGQNTAGTSGAAAATTAAAVGTGAAGATALSSGHATAGSGAASIATTASIKSGVQGRNPELTGLSDSAFISQPSAPGMTFGTGAGLAGTTIADRSLGTSGLEGTTESAAVPSTAETARPSTGYQDTTLGGSGRYIPPVTTGSAPETTGETSESVRPTSSDGVAHSGGPHPTFTGNRLDPAFRETISSYHEEVAYEHQVHGGKVDVPVLTGPTGWDAVYVVQGPGETYTYPSGLLDTASTAGAATAATATGGARTGASTVEAMTGGTTTGRNENDITGYGTTTGVAGMSGLAAAQDYAQGGPTGESETGGARGLGSYDDQSYDTTAADGLATTATSDTGPASKTIGPHSSNVLNVLDPRVKPEPEKMRQEETTQTTDSNYGRDAALAGTAGAAGVGAYEYERSRDPTATADTSETAATTGTLSESDKPLAVRKFEAQQSDTTIQEANKRHGFYGAPEDNAAYDTTGTTGTATAAEPAGVTEAYDTTGPTATAVPTTQTLGETAGEAETAAIAGEDSGHWGIDGKIGSGPPGEQSSTAARIAAMTAAMKAEEDTTSRDGHWGTDGPIGQTSYEPPSGADPTDEPGHWGVDGKIGSSTSGETSGTAATIGATTAGVVAANDTSDRSGHWGTDGAIGGTSYEQPTTTSYEQPTATSYEQLTAASYEQPTVTRYEQPTTTSYVVPAATSYEQPTATSYEQPTVTRYEEPTATSYVLPAATSYEQPTATSYQQPITGRYEQPADTTTSTTTDEAARPYETTDDYGHSGYKTQREVEPYGTAGAAGVSSSQFETRQDLDHHIGMEEEHRQQTKGGLLGFLHKTQRDKYDDPSERDTVAKEKYFQRHSSVDAGAAAAATTAGTIGTTSASGKAGTAGTSGAIAAYDYERYHEPVITSGATTTTTAPIGTAVGYSTEFDPYSTERNSTDKYPPGPSSAVGMSGDYVEPQTTTYIAPKVDSTSGYTGADAAVGSSTHPVTQAVHEEKKTSAPTKSTGTTSTPAVPSTRTTTTTTEKRHSGLSGFFHRHNPNKLHKEPPGGKYPAPR